MPLLGGYVHGFEDFSIDPGQEQQAAEHGGHFCNGERPPYQVYIAAEGEQIRHRQQHNDLTDEGNDHAVDAVAQSLKHRGDDDAESRRRGS